MKRIFLIVLDSVGIGELPDAGLYGDEGSNTLYGASLSSYFSMDNMKKLGLFNIDGVKEKFSHLEEDIIEGSIARLGEKSKGKDTTTGHFEIAGLISESPFPTFPHGFPQEIITEISSKINRPIICNEVYSGTDVIRDYGRQHIETGALIVYTSADSVFQIAAHEDVIPIEDLYYYCQVAREALKGDYAVGRVIARPFTGQYPNFIRTSNRRDFSLIPSRTMLDQLSESGLDVLAIGKVKDIFAGKGITKSMKTSDNADGIEKIITCIDEEFKGLCFANLVDFDSLYGHRNDVDGYAKALSYFDGQLPRILKALKEDDILMITADHGCDPSTPSTDHSREYVPLIIYGHKIKPGYNLNTRDSFCDIAATVLEYFNIEQEVAGQSFLREVLI